MTKTWFSYFLKVVKKVSPVTEHNISPLCFKAEGFIFHGCQAVWEEMAPEMVQQARQCKGRCL